VTATCYGYTKGYRNSNANGHPHTDCNTGAYFNAHPHPRQPHDANLTRATLTDANLTGAILTGADLTGAYLTSATLTEADLTGATLIRANLTEADLTNATMPGFKDSQPTSLKDAAQKPRIGFPEALGSRIMDTNPKRCLRGFMFCMPARGCSICWWSIRACAI
jgi:uncharacterized protein YjbI with pentapeptide repeats